MRGGPLGKKTSGRAIATRCGGRCWRHKCPAGKNQLLVIVTDAQRDFSKAGLQPAGPFSMISANPVAAKDIQLVSTSSASADSSECSDGAKKRTLVVQQRCSNAFGAAMVMVEEVN